MAKAKRRQKYPLPYWISIEASILFLQYKKEQESIIIVPKPFGYVKPIQYDF